MNNCVILRETKVQIYRHVIDNRYFQPEGTGNNGYIERDA